MYQVELGEGIAYQWLPISNGSSLAKNYFP